MNAEGAEGEARNAEEERRAGRFSAPVCCRHAGAVLLVGWREGGRRMHSTRDH
jgi:hypothetical protein